MTSCQQIGMSWSFSDLWPILSNLEGRIPDALCELTFSLKVTFYLTKTENTALTLLLWVKVLFSPKNADLFSETTNECVLTYKISSS